MSIRKRLQALEEKCSPRKLYVLAINADGEQQEMTAKECIDNGYQFCKVVEGNNLEELDEPLAIMTKVAFEDQEGSNNGQSNS